MSQFAREDFQGDVDFVSNGNITLESDRDQDGVGDLVFRTAGVERARIKHDGTGTGWSNVLGGSNSEMPSWGTGQHHYDRELYVYNRAALKRFRAAMARAIGGGTPLHIACYGDSITYGGNLSSPLEAKSYPGHLRAMLNRRLASAGSGIVPCWTTQLNDSRLTYGGTWTDYRNSGFSRHSAQATGTGNTITFAPTASSPLICDSFNIYYRKSSTEGTFTAAVDGGTATNINATNATEAFGVANVSAGLLGSHSLVITAPASGTATIIGVEAVVSTGLVKVTSAGFSGAVMADIQHNTYLTDSLYTACDMAPADLVILMMETNDYGNYGTAIATYTAEWNTFVTEAQAQGSDVLVVLTVPPEAPRTAPAGSPTLAQYSNALYGIADSFNTALVDMQDRWTDWTTSNALGLYSDDYHPSQAGYDDVARAVYNAVFSSWSTQTLVDDTGKLSQSVFAVAPVSPRSGDWYGTPCATSAGVARFNNEGHAVPVEFGSSVTLQAIGINVTGAGSTGSVARLGIYTDKNGYPNALVVDAGTVDCTTTGGKSIAITNKLPPGRYWLVCALQGGAVTQPTIWSLPATSFAPGGVGATSLTGTGASGWMNNASMSGALPSTFPSPSTAPAGSPRVMVQIA